MELAELLERAKRQLADTTGLKAVAVTGAVRNDQGWNVGVELLELSRIPAASDVLGDYEAVLAEDGSMLAFHRKRTRIRGEPVEDES